MIKLFQLLLAIAFDAPVPEIERLTVAGQRNEAASAGLVRLLPLRMHCHRDYF